MIQIHTEVGEALVESTQNVVRESLLSLFLRAGAMPGVPGLIGMIQ